MFDASVHVEAIREISLRRQSIERRFLSRTIPCRAFQLFPFRCYGHLSADADLGSMNLNQPDVRQNRGNRKGNERTSVLQKYEEVRRSTNKYHEASRSTKKSHEVSYNMFVKAYRKNPDFGPRNSKIRYTIVFGLQQPDSGCKLPYRQV